MTVDLTHTEKPGIILLYDSDQIYQRFVNMFSDDYHIYWGNTLNNTMDILASSSVAVMVCDIHFHNQAILPVVLALKDMHPEIVPMIVSPASDKQAVAELDTQEEIFSTLVRPVTTERLRQTLAEAVLFHRDQNSQDETEDDRWEESQEAEAEMEAEAEQDDSEIPPQIAANLALMSAQIEQGNYDDEPLADDEPEAIEAAVAVAESEQSAPENEVSFSLEEEQTTDADQPASNTDETESMFEMELELDTESFAKPAEVPADIAALDEMNFAVADDEDDDFDEVFFVDIQEDEH